MSIFKIIIAKSNLHQIKLKQHKLNYTSLEKILDLSSVDWATGRQKRANFAEFKNTFLFLKATNFSHYYCSILTEINQMFNYISIGSN